MQEPHKIFDGIFHRIMETASRKAIIDLINGLFHADFPAKSTVEFPNPIATDEKLNETISDMLILINRTSFFHIELQTAPQSDMVIRLFRYDFAAGLKYKTVAKNGDITIKLHKAVVVYLESTKNTPDTHRIFFEFPMGKSHRIRWKP